MRRPHFSVFNMVQCAITLGAILFGIYGMMQAADRPANQLARPQNVAIADSDEPAPRISNRIEIPPAPSPVVDTNPVNSNPSDHGDGVISGSVTFTNGKAAAGVRVAAVSVAARITPPGYDATDPAKSRREYDRYFRELERQTRVVRTDAAGKFSFTGLDDKSSYNVTAGDRDMGVTQQVAACGSDVKFAFESPVFLDGLVERLDGGSVEPFTVTVESQKDNYWYPVQSVRFDDAGGQFRIRAVQGKVRVTAAMANLIQAEDCIVDVPAEGGRVELRLSRAASLHGKVTGSDGNALAGVVVMVVVPGEEEDQFGRRNSPERPNAEDEDKSSSKQAKVADALRDREGSQMPRDAQAKAEAEARVKEKFASRKKNPRSRDKSSEALYKRAGKSGNTDAKGEYRIEGIKPGKYTVRAMLGALVDSREAVLVSGDNLVDFTIDTGCRVRLSARNTKGEMVKQVQATFQTLDYGYVSATVTQAADGSLEFLGLPEGKFIISAQAQGYAMTTLEVVLGRGINTFEVALSEPATVKGHVATRNGHVPKDVYVKVVPQEKRNSKDPYANSGEQYLSLDAKGDFVSQALAPGLYDLQVVTQGQEVLYTQDLTLSTGEQTVDIVMDDGCSLTVNVKFDGEKPEPGASVVITNAGDQEGRSQRYAQLENGRAEFLFLKEGDYYVMALSQNASQSWVAVSVRQGANSIEIKVGKSNCVRITGVAPDSQGAKAGIKDGDLITEYNGKAINTLAELVTEIQAATSQESVVLTIVRDGASMTFTLKGGKIGIGGQDWHR